MKKLYTTLLIIFCFSFCRAQWVTIPDANFVAWLQNTSFDSCMNGNQLDTTCPEVLNAKTVNCSFLTIGNITYLTLNITDLTGIQYFKNLDTLICSSNTLYTLPNLPASLIYLDCSYNDIDTLPSLPSSLNALKCDWNNFTKYPTLPLSLTYLDCQFSSFAINLPVLPPTLDTLFCNNDQLSTLPALPSSLNYLECSNNYITGLPALPGNLSYLDCSYNSLDSLPVLPGNLTYLYCSHNPLNNLPFLPSYLYYLDCSYNQLGSLLVLPPSYLSYLDCSYNQLGSLPTNLLNLTELFCEHNLLSSLPTPLGVYSLNCSNNNLTSLPPLLYQMNELLVDSNPLLTCLPPITLMTSWLPGINGTQPYYVPLSFNVSGTGITCLTNLIQHPDTPSYPAIDTMPICDVFNNPYGCAQTWNIEGNVYSDTANNCDTTVIEPVISNVKIDLLDSTGTNLLQQVYTNYNGEYSFEVAFGKYQVRVDTTSLPLKVFCPTNNIYTSNITSLDSLDYNADFRVICKNNTAYDLGVSSVNYVQGSFFPGWTTLFSICAGDVPNFYSLPCKATGISGSLKVIFSGPVSYEKNAGTLAPDSISGDTISWHVADFSSTNFCNSFAFWLNIDTSAHSGQEVCFTITITADSGIDANPSNNILTQCLSIHYSLDPNYKEVYPSSTTNPGEWLTYTIHFQNTGSAPAENIYVLDTIDNNLDISSIQVLAESNNAIIQVLPGRILRFSFPNIFLPDSTDNADSSVGYVQYKIKTDSTISPNTIINNTASVYFDYNAPVQTNNAVSAFDVTSGVNGLQVSGLKFQVFPNPTSGVVNVVMGELCNDCIITITDLTGRILDLTPSPSPKERGTFAIDLGGLAAGVYFIRVSSAQQTGTVKVVKE